MTQNIYDNPEFFQAYGQLERSIQGLPGAVEWPTLRDLLPKMGGLKVLDLGCGYGWFCRWAREAGAASVHGIDVSERMLTRARELTSDTAITYTQADLESVELPVQSFDLVYSSLAFHYIAHLPELIGQIRQSLVPDGKLVFSVEHPIYTAPSHAEWSPDAAGHPIWPLDSYQMEGPRSTDWLTKGIIKQHRTIATYINLLLELDFSLSRIIEWGPTDEQVASHPHLADERHRPPFLLVSAVLRGRGQLAQLDRGNASLHRVPAVL